MKLGIYIYLCTLLLHILLIIIDMIYLCSTTTTYIIDMPWVGIILLHISLMCSVWSSLIARRGGRSLCVVKFARRGWWFQPWVFPCRFQLYIISNGPQHVQILGWEPTLKKIWVHYIKSAWVIGKVLLLRSWHIDTTSRCVVLIQQIDSNKLIFW